MTRSPGKHMTEESREVIEEGVRKGESTRKIARKAGVSPSTVTREVKANRVMRERRAARGAKLSVRCARYSDCRASGSACEKGSTRLTTCKNCRTRSCIDTCPDFVRKMCPATERWPYVCPKGCPKRAHCGYPKCSHGARAAQEAHEARLSASRRGLDVSDEELAAMRGLVAPLLRQGQSFEAIWRPTATSCPCA